MNPTERQRLRSVGGCAWVNNPTCNYYVSARACPVGFISAGEKNPEIGMNLSQTTLIANELANIDINNLREILESKVLSSERSQEILALENEFY